MPSSTCRACAGSPTLFLRSTDRAPSCSSHDPPATPRCGCCSPSSWATPHRRQCASVRTIIAGTLGRMQADRSSGRAADNAVGESRGHLAQQAVEELVQRRLGHVERLAASTLVKRTRASEESLRLTSCQNSVGDARCPEALQLAKRCGKAAEYAQLWPGTAQHQRRSCQRCDRRLTCDLKWSLSPNPSPSPSQEETSLHKSHSTSERECRHHEWAARESGAHCRARARLGCRGPWRMQAARRRPPESRSPPHLQPRQIITPSSLMRGDG
eukprot:COSAG04_NODE_3647_length_2640_cov_14.093270_4_plen_270_part_00